ncbi:MAG: nucleotidyl transferase AbiEii/AbiGii toxin family protein [Coriobacteriales bacterium]|nr:nucleotidyl transferase AbiEii/AbiGii toxin family protein [Coriobacteriales bacterium]
MERFLERVSLSQYKDRLILKGGVLVSSIVGLASRTTLDIDSSVKDLPLTPDDILCVVDAIVSVPLEDGMSFAVKSVRVVEARGTDDVVEGEGTTRGLQGLLYDVHARLIAVVSHPALYGYSC